MSNPKNPKTTVQQPEPSTQEKKGMSAGLWYFIGVNIIMALVVIYKIFFH
jgi:hypothetical protein